MDMAQHFDQPPAEAPATLGDVLYARKAQTLVPESEWVALVQSIAAGDQAALHALYERSHRTRIHLDHAHHRQPRNR